ncbi:hypothetical protein BJ508DRAFT_330128 [Ascobolus immersus RN42]|uniref:Uncharacterized protein n=1 Tax=Ascobolus immersus RN42 TaxID=1160509 RepID=A0A3N4HUK7_ASCIM|nr:hypothetical protein BJ508DRAFT_330128 [Ascobolus immersus RN42]
MSANFYIDQELDLLKGSVIMSRRKKQKYFDHHYYHWKPSPKGSWHLSMLGYHLAGSRSDSSPPYKEYCPSGICARSTDPHMVKLRERLCNMLAVVEAREKEEMSTMDRQDEQRQKEKEARMKRRMCHCAQALSLYEPFMVHLRMPERSESHDHDHATLEISSWASMNMASSETGSEWGLDVDLDDEGLALPDAETDSDFDSDEEVLIESELEDDVQSFDSDTLAAQNEELTSLDVTTFSGAELQADNSNAQEAEGLHASEPLAVDAEGDLGFLPPSPAAGNTVVIGTSDSDESESEEEQSLPVVQETRTVKLKPFKNWVDIAGEMVLLAQEEYSDGTCHPYGDCSAQRGIVCDHTDFDSKEQPGKILGDLLFHLFGSKRKTKKYGSPLSPCTDCAVSPSVATMKACIQARFKNGLLCSDTHLQRPLDSQDERDVREVRTKCYKRLCECLERDFRENGASTGRRYEQTYLYGSAKYCSWQVPDDRPEARSDLKAWINGSGEFFKRELWEIAYNEVFDDSVVPECVDSDLWLRTAPEAQKELLHW